MGSAVCLRGAQTTWGDFGEWSPAISFAASIPFLGKWVLFSQNDFSSVVTKRHQEERTDDE